MSKEALQKKMDNIKAQYDSQLVKLNTDGKAGKRKSGKSQKKVHALENVESVDEVNDCSQPQEREDTELVDYDLNEMITELESNIVVSPPASNAPKASNDDAAQRLQQLQELVVGGEQANNEEIKKKRTSKKKYAEERKQKLAESLRNGDDDEFMLRVYDSVQEEVKYKTELYKKEKEKCKFLENECKDLQQEFEKERQLLLDTIRKNEKQMTLFAKILQKIQPIVPSDSNYYNIDRIQSLSQWNEEAQDWTLPDFKREKLSLPSMGPADNLLNGRNNGNFNNQEDFDDWNDGPMMNKEQQDMKYQQFLLNSRKPQHDAALSFIQPREPEVDRY